MKEKPFKIVTKGRKVDVTFPTRIETNRKVFNGKNWWIIKDQKTREIVGVFVKLNSGGQKKDGNVKRRSTGIRATAL